MSAFIIWNCLEALLAAAGEGLHALGGCSCCEDNGMGSRSGAQVSPHGFLFFFIPYCSLSETLVRFSLAGSRFCACNSWGKYSFVFSLVALCFLCSSLLAILIIASSSSQPQPCPAFLRELCQVKSQTWSSYVFKSYWNMVSVWRRESSTA